MILPTFYWIIFTHSEFALIAGISVLNVLSNFIWGSAFAGLTESLPKTIRGGGFGAIYSVSVAFFGGTMQLMVTWLIHLTGGAMAPAWYVTGVAAVGQIALMLMTESASVRSPRPLELVPALPS